MVRSLYLPHLSLTQPNLDAPWVHIQSVVTAKPCWRCVLVHHLTPEENGNNHHVYVDVLGTNGQWLADLSSLRLGWTWVGKRADEPAPDKLFDKQPSEPATNLDLYKGQIAFIWIKDNYPSDVVAGLRTDLPGGDLFHHSHYVVFQLVDAVTPAPVVVAPLSVEARLALVEARLATVNAVLHLWND